jgi:hydroxylamine reductase (hybrid-cluster protein)
MDLYNEILLSQNFGKQANKYRTTISKIFRKFGTNLRSSADKTICATAKTTHKGMIYEKKWTLHTYNYMLKFCLKQLRLKSLSQTFLQRENGHIGNYIQRSTTPTVTNENFLESITWYP